MVDEKTKESTKTLKDKRIDKASNNFKLIANNIVNQKFEHIDSWIYKTSKIYKTENSNISKIVYPRFEYGTIIKVDFGINEGSELSNPHFAIVLDKYDSTKNPVITILPLTSQNKKHNLPLNELIVDEFTKRLNKQLNKLYEEINELEKKDNATINEIDSKGDEIKLLQNMINYYSNYAKSSYACINQITTISKGKIIKPKNRFDIIGRAKCSSKTMTVISSAIMKKYTNLHINFETDNKN